MEMFEAKVLISLNNCLDFSYSSQMKLQDDFCRTFLQ